MLDINTPKGRIAAQQQAVALSIISAKTDVRFVTTVDDDAAAVDAFSLDESGRITSVLEVKSRDMSLDELQKRFTNEWLVTFEKLQKGAALGRLLCVPFGGVLYLTKDNTVLALTLSNKNGEFVAPIRICRTETQKTTNGGTIIRTNAYINMEQATEFRG